MSSQCAVKGWGAKPVGGITDVALVVEGRRIYVSKVVYSFLIP